MMTLDIEKEEMFLRKRCEALEIPDYMVNGIIGHVVHGQPTGSFLASVFNNDLCGAATRADQTNLHLLRQYAWLLHNELPSECYGSPAKTKAWRERGGMERGGPIL